MKPRRGIKKLEEPWFGWYSSRQARTGTSIYSTPEGGEVEVSQINHSPTESGCGGQTADEICCVGEVVKWLREGRRHSGMFK